MAHSSGPDAYQDPSRRRPAPVAPEDVLRQARERHTGYKSSMVSANPKPRSIGMARMQYGDGEYLASVESLQMLREPQQPAEPLPDLDEPVRLTHTLSRSLVRGLSFRKAARQLFSFGKQSAAAADDEDADEPEVEVGEVPSDCISRRLRGSASFTCAAANGPRSSGITAAGFGSGASFTAGSLGSSSSGAARGQPGPNPLQRQLLQQMQAQKQRSSLQLQRQQAQDSQLSASPTSRNCASFDGLPSPVIDAFNLNNGTGSSLQPSPATFSGGIAASTTTLPRAPQSPAALLLLQQQPSQTSQSPKATDMLVSVDDLAPGGYCPHVNGASAAPAGTTAAAAAVAAATQRVDRMLEDLRRPDATSETPLYANSAFNTPQQQQQLRSRSSLAAAQLTSPAAAAAAAPPLRGDSASSVGDGVAAARPAQLAHSRSLRSARGARGEPLFAAEGAAAAGGGGEGEGDFLLDSSGNVCGSPGSHASSLLRHNLSLAASSSRALSPSPHSPISTSPSCSTPGGGGGGFTLHASPLGSAVRGSMGGGGLMAALRTATDAAVYSSTSSATMLAGNAAWQASAPHTTYGSVPGGVPAAAASGGGGGTTGSGGSRRSFEVGSVASARASSALGGWTSRPMSQRSFRVNGTSGSRSSSFTGPAAASLQHTLLAELAAEVPEADGLGAGSKGSRSGSGGGAAATSSELKKSVRSLGATGVQSGGAGSAKSALAAVAEAAAAAAAGSLPVLTALSGGVQRAQAGVLSMR